MPAYRGVFVIPDVAVTHRAYLQCIQAGVEADRIRVQRGLLPVNEARVERVRIAYQEFQAGLRDAARIAALNATERIDDQIRKTAKRDDTGVSPHLRDRIICRALPKIGLYETGAVGIADEEILDDGGKGFYWKSQEFGTGSPEVRSIIGTKLRGYFYGTGYGGFPSPPDPGQFRNHPLFYPGPPLGGQKVRFGIGIVRREVQARHFIRDGALLAEAKWAAQINALQSQQVGVIKSLL